MTSAAKPHQRPTVGLLLYGLNQQTRDAASEDKYQLLVSKMREQE